MHYIGFHLSDATIAAVLMLALGAVIFALVVYALSSCDLPPEPDDEGVMVLEPPYDWERE